MNYPVQLKIDLRQNVIEPNDVKEERTTLPCIRHWAVSRIRNFRTWHNSILFSFGPERRGAFLTA